MKSTATAPALHAMAKAITRTALSILFFGVFFLSVLVSPDSDGSVYVVCFVKAVLAVGLGWLFFLIISDALVRSITASAAENHSTRRDGGLLYHFLPPDPDELSDEEADVQDAAAEKKK